MKPLWLSLEGLQSYSERQVIDFSQVGGGLFGIFGPTGSGKSTVLDAMTLALFGSVGRASHNTQGIINSACDRVAVSFAFELSLRDGRQAFRIDRLYRRKNKSQDSCDARICRLVRLNAGSETVLADKPADINAAVASLLGLGYDDFVRAVVLPQNQFQAFLLLTKKEKSDMLERLFCLEAYGQDLIRKISRGRRLAEDDMKQLSGALEILGDCTDDAVCSMRGTCEISGAARLEADQASIILAAQAAAGREIYQMSCRKAGLAKRQSELAEHAGIIEVMKKRLDASRSAEPAWPVFQDLQRLSAQIGRQEPVVLGLTAQVADLENQLARTKADLSDWQKGAAEHKAGMASSITAMDKALGLAVQSSDLQDRLSHLAGERQTLSAMKDAAYKEAAAVETALQDSRARLENARAARKSCQVDPDWRKTLEDWNNLMKLRQADEQALESGKKQQDDLTAGIREITARIESQRRSLTSQENRVIREVSARLLEGEPCPVCGSSRHPAPAFTRPELQETADDADRASDQKQLTRLEERLAASLVLCGQQQSRLDGYAREMEKLAGQYPVLRLSVSPETELQTLYSQEKSAAEAEREILEHEKAASGFADRFQKEKGRGARLDGEIAGHDRLIAEISGQLAKHQAEIGNLLAGRAAASCTPGQLRQDLDALRAACAQWEETGRRLDENCQTLQSRKMEIERRQIEEKTNLGHLDVNRSRLEAQLSEILQSSGFPDTSSMAAARLEPASAAGIEKEIRLHDDEVRDLASQSRQYDDWLQGRWLGESDWQVLEESARQAAERREQAMLQDDRNKRDFQEMTERLAKKKEKEGIFKAVSARRDRISQIETLVRGNAFVEFVAEERLRAIVAEASGFLETMTRCRYALELDDEMSFVVRDLMSGGQVRQAKSLSGGETFMASLALALALSSQIQLRGQSRLEFFFLDEGFGSLDPAMLEIVMDSLERISNPSRMIGLISHVPELRQRISTRLVVEAPAGGKGSRIRLERY
jgi:DNA repair protein SbcC/Rad50